MQESYLHMFISGNCFVHSSSECVGGVGDVDAGGLNETTFYIYKNKHIYVQINKSEKIYCQFFFAFFFFTSLCKQIGLTWKIGYDNNTFIKKI